MLAWLLPGRPETIPLQRVCSLRNNVKFTSMFWCYCFGRYLCICRNPKSIRTIQDPLQKAVIQHCWFQTSITGFSSDRLVTGLNTKSRLIFDDTSLDSRFASEAQQSTYRSAICLPIFSNRGQTFGAVYLASRYHFSQLTVKMLTLLLQQASISIANALLFRSVQAGTRENLKMISSQRAALEKARKSQEDALKATKVITSIYSLPKSLHPCFTDKKQLFSVDESRAANSI